MNLHPGLLIAVRTVVTFMATIFALMLLGDTRRIYRMPWVFTFIAIRLSFSLLLRGVLWVHGTVDLHLDGALKTSFAFLDLFTIIQLWLGYGTVFDETPFRRWVRRWWPFK